MLNPLLESALQGFNFYKITNGVPFEKQMANSTFLYDVIIGYADYFVIWSLFVLVTGFTAAVVSAAFDFILGTGKAFFESSLP